MIPSAYYSSWRAVSHQSPGHSRRLGVLPGNRLGRAWPACTASVTSSSAPGRRDHGRAFRPAIGDEDLYRIPDSGVGHPHPSDRNGRLPADDAVGTPGPGDPLRSGILEGGHRRRRPQVLRLRLTDVPGWHATIDGRPVPLQRFAGVMLQMEVPAGHHTIELTTGPRPSPPVLCLPGARSSVSTARVFGWVRRRRHRRDCHSNCRRTSRRLGRRSLDANPEGLRRTSASITTVLGVRGVGDSRILGEPLIWDLISDAAAPVRTAWVTAGAMYRLASSRLLHLINGRSRRNHDKMVRERVTTIGNDDSHDIIPVWVEEADGKEHREMPKVEGVGDDAKRHKGLELEEVTSRPSAVQNRQDEDGTREVDRDESSPIDERPFLGGKRKARRGGRRRRPTRRRPGPAWVPCPGSRYERRVRPTGSSRPECRCDRRATTSGACPRTKCTGGRR